MGRKNKQKLQQKLHHADSSVTQSFDDSRNVSLNVPKAACDRPATFYSEDFQTVVSNVARDGPVTTMLQTILERKSAELLAKESIPILLEQKLTEKDKLLLGAKQQIASYQESIGLLETKFSNAVRSKEEADLEVQQMKSKLSEQIRVAEEIRSKFTEDSKLVDSAQSHIIKLKDEVEKATSRVTELELERSTTRNDFELMKGSVSKLCAKNRDLGMDRAALIKEKEVLTANLSDCEEKLKRLESEVNCHKETLADMKVLLSNVQKDLQEKISQMKNTEQEEKGKYQELESQILSLNSEKLKIQEDADSMKTAIKKLKKERESLTKKLKKQSDLIKENDEAKKLIESLESSMELKLNESNEEREKTVSELESLKKSYEDLSRADADMQSLLKQNAELRKSNETFDSQISDLNNALADTEKRFEQSLRDLMMKNYAAKEELHKLEEEGKLTPQVAEKLLFAVSEVEDAHNKTLMMEADLHRLRDIEVKYQTVRSSAVQAQRKYEIELEAVRKQLVSATNEAKLYKLQSTEAANNSTRIMKEVAQNLEEKLNDATRKLDLCEKMLQEKNAELISVKELEVAKRDALVKATEDEKTQLTEQIRTLEAELEIAEKASSDMEINNKKLIENESKKAKKAVKNAEEARKKLSRQITTLQENLEKARSEMECEHKRALELEELSSSYSQKIEQAHAELQNKESELNSFKEQNQKKLNRFSEEAQIVSKQTEVLSREKTNLERELHSLKKMHVIDLKSQKERIIRAEEESRVKLQLHIKTLEEELEANRNYMSGRDSVSPVLASSGDSFTKDATSAVTHEELQKLDDLKKEIESLKDSEANLKNENSQLSQGINCVSAFLDSLDKSETTEQKTTVPNVISDAQSLQTRVSDVFDNLSDLLVKTRTNLNQKENSFEKEKEEMIAVQRKLAEDNIALKDALNESKTKTKFLHEQLGKHKEDRERAGQLQSRLDVLQTSALHQQKRLEKELADTQNKLESYKRNDMEKLPELEDRLRKVEFYEIENSNLKIELSSAHDQCRASEEYKLNQRELIDALELRINELTTSAAEERSGLVDELIRTKSKLEETERIKDEYLSECAKIAPLESELEILKQNSTDQEFAMAPIALQEESGLENVEDEYNWDEAFPILGANPAIRNISRRFQSFQRNHGQHLPQREILNIVIVTYAILLHYWIFFY